MSPNIKFVKAFVNELLEMELAVFELHELVLRCTKGCERSDPLRLKFLF